MMKRTIIILAIFIISVLFLTACQEDLAGEAGKAVSELPQPEDGGSGGDVPEDPGGDSDGDSDGDGDTNVTTYCTDSDGGIEYYIRGTLNCGYEHNETNYSFTDNCISSDTILQEFYCDNDWIASEHYTCPFGCDDGVCLEELITNESQTDFFVELVSVVPEKPVLGDTWLVTYRYGNNGPDGGYASSNSGFITPSGGGGGTGPITYYPAGSSFVKTGTHDIDDGEGWYSRYVSLNPEIPEGETNWSNNNFTVRAYVYGNQSNQTNETHWICQNEECVEIEGEGTDECISDDECVVNQTNETHRICQNEECIEVEGEGTDECISDDECVINQTNETHKECAGEICLDIPGAGTDECTYDYQCQTTNGTHKVCQNEQCIDMPGAGTDECSYNWQCEASGPETDFYAEFVSVEPENPFLGDRITIHFKYGNHGPDGGNATFSGAIYTPNGGDAGGAPGGWFEPGEVRNGSQNITLNDGEGLYGLNWIMNPAVDEWETDWSNNHLDYSIYVTLGNCSDYDGSICGPKQRCDGSWIPSGDSERCCDGECKKRTLWDMIMEFFTGND